MANVPSLYTRITAQNIPGPYKQDYNYTLFRDAEDSDLYYIMPEAPIFNETANGSGIPSFSMIWYSSNKFKKAGGVCSFQIALPMPDTTDPTVMKKLAAAITQDPALVKQAQQILKMAELEKSGKKEEAEKIRVAEGLSPSQAQKYYEAYDKEKDYTQFFTVSQKLKFQPMPVKSGAVTMLAFGSEDAYQNWNGDLKDVQYSQFQAAPSLLSNNAAVLSLDLTEMGTALFWQALGGPDLNGLPSQPSNIPEVPVNSVVSITYSLNFDAMLPAATATVKLDASKVGELVLQNKSSKDTWGHTSTWQEVAGKKYSEDIDSSLKVSIPSSYYNEDNPSSKKTLEESMRSWAETQLADMMKSQLPDVDMNQLGLDAKAPEKITNLKNDSRTYTLSKAINFTVGPNGMLPKLNSIVDDKVLKTLFTYINLDLAPYYNVGINLLPPSSNFMKSRKVDSIAVTQITFADQQLFDEESKSVSSVIFSADADLKPALLTGSYSNQSNNRIIDYSYMVTYADGSTPYRVNNIQVDPLDEGGFILDFASTQSLGVVYTEIDGTFLPWGALSRVRVDLKYGDIEDTILLTKEDPSVDWAQPLGELVDQVLEYKVTYTLTDGGNPMTYPRDGNSYASFNVVEDDKLTLPGPFGTSDGTHQYDFLLTSGTRALIRAQYLFPVSTGLNRNFTKTFSLSTSDDSESWSVPAPQTGAAALTIQKAVVFDADGHQHQPSIEPIDSVASIIDVNVDKISAF